MHKSIYDEVFQEKHKRHPKAFTRERKLTFPLLLSFQLQKGVKSLQLRLNELCLKLSSMSSVTKSAYSQARQKYSHTAFIDMNQQMLRQYYAENAYSCWHGKRLLGIDGSYLILPNHSEIIKTYGSQHIPETDHHKAGILPAGKLSLCYDVLNNLALNGILAKHKDYEVNLAKEHEEVFTEQDIVLFDRHYASYEFIAWLSQQPCDFIIRCPKSTFKAGIRMFQGGPWSRIVDLEAPGGTIKKLKKTGLPTNLTVRFVRVKLPTGESEVLVTSLQQKELTRHDFLEAYGLRWGIETYFGLLKERLNLENFTGKNVESVKQDLYSTLLVSNLETILTEDIDVSLAQKGEKNIYEQQVNKSVSFNLIKNRVFELLYHKKINLDKVLQEMTVLFLQSPVLKRRNRHVDRNLSGAYRRLRYNKTVRKICF